MLENLILGIAQGVFEWLPVSSEGIIVLLKTNFFGGTSLTESVYLALFLHLGTLLAALIYFWSDIVSLVKKTIRYKDQNQGDKNKINFYFIATLTSGVFGFLILRVLDKFETIFLKSAVGINIFIGLMLLLTAYLQFKNNRKDGRNIETATTEDAVYTGVGQGLSPIPGISRSGTTVSVLLLRRFSKKDALIMSFILSIPIVLAANIGLFFDGFVFTKELLVGFLTSFIFGYVTIKGLMLLARKINFGWFVLVFGVLVIVSTFL